MSKPSETIAVSIDNQALRVDPGITILDAAKQCNIFIPTLCTHKDLTPYGGCRICIVEVDGMRGFPTACTTPVVDGMVIRTNTIQLQSIRSEILQLILSEHPCSCLICDEQDECREFTGTIRKAAVTTGCRYCPNDGQCELADVVKKLGIREISYPISYRNYRIEKEDPFYDRDYNLCILCGRCIRMCQEIRAANTLTFKQRGRDTLIGPAYNRTHIEAGCEFCGACVSICPTGALSEKTRKWEGKTEREVTTTCSFCGIGCQVQLQIKGHDVIGALPVDDLLINNGQLCVKGRFCIPEMVNNHRRLKRPYITYDSFKVEITPDQALEKAAEKLANCQPHEFGMIISQNCTNEDLYIAQKFTRLVMGSGNIDTGAGVYYGKNFNSYINLLKKPATLEQLRKASAILCIGLDTRYGRSVVGVELRKAAKRGASIISINSHPHNLSIIAEIWLKPDNGHELDIIRSLIRLTGKDKKDFLKTDSGKKKQILDQDIIAAAKIFAKSSSTVILIGHDVLRYEDGPRILDEIEKLAEHTRAGIMPMPSQNNLYGSLLMGAYSGLLPGGCSSTNSGCAKKITKVWDTQIPKIPASWNSGAVVAGEGIKVLYSIGDISLRNYLSPEFSIFQSIYPPEPFSLADLVIPSAAFTEIDGTFINGEGRLQRVRKGIEPPGFALPDWKILCLIAQKMGKKGFDFSSAEEVHTEIGRLVDGFDDMNNIRRQLVRLPDECRMPTIQGKIPMVQKSYRKFPFRLYTASIEHTYHGIPLSHHVEGLRKLLTENLLEMNPADAEEAGLVSGDEVVVTSNNFEKIWPVKIMAEQSLGTLQITLSQGEIHGDNPYLVKIRKKHV